MSENLEQSIKENDQAIAGAKAEINLGLKQLPEDIRSKLASLIGTEEFNKEVEKLQATYLAKIKELGDKLVDICRD